MLPRANQSPTAINLPETAIENMTTSLQTIEVLDAISHIEKTQGMIFCERHILQHSVKEIAEQHGMTERHVRRVIGEAIINVRKILTTVRSNGHSLSIISLERDNR